MNFYNMINGVTQATFLFLPMLGKHPAEYPRFRDCFLKDSEHPEYDDHIHVYTRTGGGNREAYENENEAMQNMEGFVTDYDDSYDHTFASWIFKIPEKWKADYMALIEGRSKDVSKEYIELIKKIYPNEPKTSATPESDSFDFFIDIRTRCQQIQDMITNKLEPLPKISEMEHAQGITTLNGYNKRPTADEILVTEPPVNDFYGEDVE